MTKCYRCGFEAPADATYCPNCGGAIRGIRGRYENNDVKRLIKISLLGAFLSLMIDISASVGNINLYFVPYFLSAIIIVYISGIKSLKDALVVATLTYLLANAIGNGLSLGIIYAQGQNLNVTLTLIDVIAYSITPVTAIVAGYIGSKIAPERSEIQYPTGEHVLSLSNSIERAAQKI